MGIDGVCAELGWNFCGESCGGCFVCAKLFVFAFCLLVVVVGDGYFLYFVKMMMVVSTMTTGGVEAR